LATCIHPRGLNALIKIESRLEPIIREGWRGQGIEQEQEREQLQEQEQGQASPRKRELHLKAKFNPTANYSSNWCGYAAFTHRRHQTKPLKKSVEAVSGSWKVPSVFKTHSRDCYSAIWVGIDGVSSPTVEQIGTEQ